jgi:hypothetical protein
MNVRNEDPKTYWDFTEKERAEMTRENVEALLDVELMTKGVLKVNPPVLEPEVEVPLLKDTAWFKVGELVFDTLEQAKTFMGLSPHKSNYEYLGGGWANKLEYSERYTADKVEMVMLKSHDDVLTHKAALEKARGVTDRNAKAKEEFQKQSNSQAKVFDGVWEDWSRQRDKLESHKRVFATFETYLKLSEGNDVTAARFLFKAIAPKDVFDAYEYMGMSLPTGIQTVKEETEKSTGGPDQADTNPS